MIFFEHQFGSSRRETALCRRALEAYYDAIDTDMRTFHHRHSFHDRGVSVSEEAVARLGLTHVVGAVQVIKNRLTP